MTVGKDFLVGGLGVEFHQKGLCQAQVFSRNFLFLDIEPKRQFSIKPETADQLGMGGELQILLQLFHSPFDVITSLVSL
jgi:hypothetical protein